MKGHYKIFHQLQSKKNHYNQKNITSNIHGKSNNIYILLGVPGQKSIPSYTWYIHYILFTQYIMTIYILKPLFLTKKPLQKHNKHQTHKSKTKREPIPLAKAPTTGEDVPPLFPGV